MKKVLSLLCMTVLIGFVSSAPRLQATEGKLEPFLGDPSLELGQVFRGREIPEHCCVDEGNRDRHLGYQPRARPPQ